MIIGDRLRAIREEKDLSQGDIESRTGLLRCYVSRVENGHTIPSVETLEKFARALETPLYRLFYEGNEPPELLKLSRGKTTEEIVWGREGKDARVFYRLREFLGKMKDTDRQLLLHMAKKMGNRHTVAKKNKKQS
jgi:transcriptional regulator with XRE-family HTH domain